jgi:hypothetical protein
MILRRNSASVKTLWNNIDRKLIQLLNFRKIECKMCVTSVMYDSASRGERCEVEPRERAPHCCKQLGSLGPHLAIKDMDAVSRYLKATISVQRLSLDLMH